MYREVWPAVTDLAEQQWGLVTTSQAARGGVTRLAISRLSAAGQLERLDHGVFAVAGSAATEHRELKAAWLRLNPSLTVAERLATPERDAVVSHTSAADIQQLGEQLADLAQFTVPRRRRSHDPLVRFHVAHLPPGDVRVVDGLPVTTPARTVLDLLAERTDGGHVGSLLVDGLNRGLIDATDLTPRLTPYASTYGCVDGAELFALLRQSSTTLLLVPESSRRWAPAAQSTRELCRHTSGHPARRISAR